MGITPLINDVLHPYRPRLNQVPYVIGVIHQWQQGRAHPQGASRSLDGVREVIKQLPGRNPTAAVRSLLSRVQVLLSRGHRFGLV